MIMDPAFGRVLDRARQGDRAAFDQVVSRYGLQVLRTARLILRDESLAEDACQEVFLKAWRRLRTLHDEEPDAWIMRIATNESLTLWRKRHRFQALTERFGRHSGSRHEVASEERLDLAHALDRLSVEQRAAIVLHYYHDLSVEETAQRLNVPVDTIKSRLKVALRRLRTMTGQEEVTHE